MLVPITQAGARPARGLPVLPSGAASRAVGAPAGPGAEAVLLHPKLFQDPCL